DGIARVISLFEKDYYISQSAVSESHSELQLRDVRNLLKGTYDQEYFRHWTARLGLDSLLNKCLHD
ncbi:MAG: hypothetical protein ABJC04_05760, partial [Verrucomicrobiota bacterium]